MEQLVYASVLKRNTLSLRIRLVMVIVATCGSVQQIQMLNRVHRRLICPFVLLLGVDVVEEVTAAAAVGGVEEGRI